MSLLNQMLNDLEQRRAEASGAPTMHREIRPLPSLPRSRPPRLLIALLLLLVAVVIGLGGWFYLGPGRPLPVVSSPSPLLVEAALPSLVASAPAIPPVAVTEPVPPAATPAPVLSPLPARATEVVGNRLRFSDHLSLPAETPPPVPPTVQAAAVAPEPVAAIEKRLLEIDPRQQAERLYRSAITQLGQGRESDGITTLRAVLRDDAGHLGARQLLIKLAIEQRDFATAQNDLAEGLQHLPKQTDWAMLLARLRVDRGDLPGALAVLEQHELHAGGAADYQAAMAAVLQRQNRHSEAETRFVRAAQAEPANGRWWLGLAMVREAQGKSVDARAAYQSALASKGLSAELRAFAEAKTR